MKNIIISSRWLSAMLLVLLAWPAEAMAQANYFGSGGTVAPNSFFCFPLQVANGNTRLDASNGVSGVCLDVSAPNVRNLEFHLVSPCGASSLLKEAGSGLGNVNGSLCFRENALLPYTTGSGGLYRPILELGNINSGATGTGVWELCIVNVGNATATLNSWSLTLGGQNVAPPLIQMGNHSCMVETCNMDLYDSGGDTYFYGDNETNINTVCPPVDGMCMQAVLTWDIENGFDNLDIYDGDSIANTTYMGTATGSGTATVQSTEGCMTFVFQSDGSVRRSGYEVELTCVPCNAAVASSRPPNDDCINAVPLTGTSGNYNATGCDIDGPNPYGTDTCTWISTENSVFYTFEVTPFTPQPVDITLTNVSCVGGANQLQCALYDNDCSTLGVFGSNFFGCASGLGTVTLRSANPNLSPGTYIFVVDGNAGSECSWAVQSAVLAVDWMDFNADYLLEERSVDLNWITTNESNNEGFWVQRSWDLQRWSSLEFVPANEGVDNLHHYSYKDAEQQPSGTVHYRLKQIDLDGKAHYSNTIDVQIGVVQEAAVLKSYPNPAANQWALQIAVPQDEEVGLQIFDQKGKEVFRQIEKDLPMGLRTLQVPLDGWATGLYFYRISIGEVSETGKLVKS